MVPLLPASRGGRRVALVLAVLVGLFVLRFLVGLGAAAYYYANTPDFATWIAEHPVASEEIARRLPAGELLATGSWSRGEPVPGDADPSSEYRVEGVRLDFRLDHGEENLVRLDFVFAVALDRKSFAHAGIHVPAPELRSREGMHAVVSVGLVDLDEMVGPESVGKGMAVVDVLLVAGEGEDEVRFVALDAAPPVFAKARGIFLPFLLRILAGLAHPAEDPPAEGLIHHLRLHQRLDWTKSSGPSFQSPRSELNHRAYSYAVETEVHVGELREGAAGSNISTWETQTITRNGETW